MLRWVGMIDHGVDGEDDDNDSEDEWCWSELGGEEMPQPLPSK